MKKIAHITTVHRRFDTRIFVKQCCTLASHPGYQVSLVVADGLQNDQREGVYIMDCGVPPGGKLGRVVFGAFRMLKACLKIRPAIVHFHDPELIPTGLVLRVLGYKVIYDIHEDFPSQLRGNKWINPLIRWPISLLLPVVEWIAARVFSALVIVTPKIAERFPAKKTVIVSNFPRLSEFTPSKKTASGKKSSDFAYVGMISPIRGAAKMVEAIGLLNRTHTGRLRLAGTFKPADFEDSIRANQSSEYVDFAGWFDRDEVAQLLNECLAGLVVFDPLPNHTDAYPNKMFEYMSAGLPVIASDFPLWRKIISEADCGLLVDPKDAASIAEALRWILEHPSEAEGMGRRGRKAVEEMYNWEQESKKLMALYQRL